MLSERELDAIVIATPVHLHHPLALQSLNAGKHVMIEKPMASSVAQCEELAGLAQKKKLTLMVGHTFLYSPHVRKIKDIIQGTARPFPLTTIQLVQNAKTQVVEETEVPSRCGSSLKGLCGPGIIDAEAALKAVLDLER